MSKIDELAEICERVKRLERYSHHELFDSICDCICDNIAQYVNNNKEKFLKFYIDGIDYNINANSKKISVLPMLHLKAYDADITEELNLSWIEIKPLDVCSNNLSHAANYNLMFLMNKFADAHFPTPISYCIYILSESTNVISGTNIERMEDCIFSREGFLNHAELIKPKLGWRDEYTVMLINGSLFKVDGMDMITFATFHIDGEFANNSILQADLVNFVIDEENSAGLFQIYPNGIATSRMQSQANRSATVKNIISKFTNEQKIAYIALGGRHYI